MLIAGFLITQPPPRLENPSLFCHFSLPHEATKYVTGLRPLRRLATAETLRPLCQSTHDANDVILGALAYLWKPPAFLDSGDWRA